MVLPPQGCPPQVLGGGKFFPKRAFHEGIFLENLSGGIVLHGGGVIIKSCKERKSFINAFFNNLNTVNLFPNNVGIFT